jgi:hypothetical protein
MWRNVGAVSQICGLKEGLVLLRESHGEGLQRLPEEKAELRDSMRCLKQKFQGPTEQTCLSCSQHNQTMLFSVSCLLYRLPLPRDVWAPLGLNKEGLPSKVFSRASKIQNQNTNKGWVQFTTPKNIGLFE